MELFPSLFCAAAAAAVTFTAGVKTGALYFCRADKSVIKFIGFFALYCAAYFLTFNNFLIGTVLRRLLSAGSLFIFFKGDPSEKLGFFTVWAALNRFTRNVLEGAFSICFMAFPESAAAEVLINTAFVFSSAALTMLLFSRTKISQGSFLKGGKILCISAGLLLLLTDLCEFGITRGITMTVRRQNILYDEMFTHIEVIILSLLCYIITVTVLFGLERLFGYAFAEKILKKETEYYKNLAVQYKNQVSVRHDMRNHLIVLKSLAEKDETEKLREYLSEVCKTGFSEDMDDDTGSGAVNAILNIKKQEAEKNNIRFTCDINIPKELSASEYDLCVIFGNILDNAVKAAEGAGEERFVNVYAQRVKSFFVISVRNSAADLPESFDARNYGTGLMNIQKAVKKKNGIMDIRTSSRRFEITVLLPIAVCDENRTSCDIIVKNAVNAPK